MTEKEIWDKAYKRIFELYGDAPDLRIVSRFFSEKQALRKKRGGLAFCLFNFFYAHRTPE